MKYSVKFLGACFFSTQVNSFYVSNFTFYAIIYLTNCRDEITQQMHLQGSPGSQSACLQVCLLLETVFWTEIASWCYQLLWNLSVLDAYSIGIEESTGMPTRLIGLHLNVIVHTFKTALLSLVVWCYAEFLFACSFFFMHGNRMILVSLESA